MANDDRPNDPTGPVGRPSKAEEHRPVWSLSPDEQRLLWITFLGGVASIVIGAAILGAAIGLDRWLLKDSATGFWLGALGSSLVLGLLWAILSQVRPQEYNVRILAVIWGLYMALYALAGIGYAAGFH